LQKQAEYVEGMRRAGREHPDLYEVPYDPHRLSENLEEQVSHPLPIYKIALVSVQGWPSKKEVVEL
jgi:hypothetical protein